MSLAELDALLSAHCREDDVGELIDAIAKDELWPGLGPGDEVASYLRSVTGDAGDLVAASLLILLSRDPGALNEVSWRVQAAELLESRLEQLRPHAAVPKEKGSHAIFAACAGVVASFVGDIRAVLGGFTELRQASSVQNSLLRRINGKAGDVIARPFLRRADGDPPLGALFDAARELATATDETRDGLFLALAQAADAAVAQADQIGTESARLLLAETAQVVRATATHEVELASPPAHVVASVRRRPLPLGEAGVTCDVLVQLTNAGAVRATNIDVTPTLEGDAAVVSDAAITFTEIDPGRSADLLIPLTVVHPSATIEISVKTSWRNPDLSLGSSIAQFKLEGQSTSIDWDWAARQEPFAAYPVEHAEELVGRHELLRRLAQQFASRPLANLYVTGQRRVGKTSLVRVLTQELRKADDRLLIAAVEMGEVRQDGGLETISELGTALSRKLIRAANARDLIDPPEFPGSLAPLNQLVEDLRDLDDRHTFLFIIDEFDELPHEMFRRPGPGDAMFLPMRSLAQKPFVGWILVGGERLPYIRDEQATRLNTFGEQRVDYLEFIEKASRDSETSSFATLVRKPLPEGFIAADDAVSRIHELSRGNPHFAKSLAAQVYRDAVRRKDAHILSEHVEDAAAEIARLSDLELFAHFWEDGIFSDDRDDIRRIELDRRHVLAALADSRRNGRSDAARVEAAAQTYGLTKASASRALNNLRQRSVLVEVGGQLTASVPLFGRWLEAEGAYQLSPKGIAEQEDDEIRGSDAASKLSAGELSRLLKSWQGFKYRGEQVTREKVEVWLSQFETDVEKRLMFRLLERLKLVTDGEVMEGLRRLNRLVAHEGTIALDRNQRSLSHMLIAGAAGSGTSGEAVAYKYRQANNVRQRNVVPLGQVSQRVAQDNDIKTVVIVDDFIGTGRTFENAFEALEAITRHDVHIYLFALAGLPDALEKLERSAAKLARECRVEVAFPLTAAELPFSQGSNVFITDADQARAETVLKKYGKNLARSMPLGFGSSAALIVLPDNCPNNAPPVLWADVNDWVPLFQRATR